MTRALAHPNIALIKYWGKQDKPGNLPATPNLSITLDSLTTTTEITEGKQDAFIINGTPQQDAKVDQFLATVRGTFDVPPLKVESANNFPTGAGLASSASGFAALMMAISHHCDLGLNREYISEWARMGSASAARSLFGGFVSLTPPVWRAQPAASLTHWPLKVVIAITSEDKKKVNSSEGMQRTAATSPYFKTWVRGAGDDYAEATDAIATRDFAKLSEVAELNCLKMHSLMLTSVPTLSYWNAATVNCMDKVRELREAGHPAFFTIDAGPQVKVVCEPDHVEAVQTAIEQTPGVLRTVTCGLGDGAQILD